MIRNISKQKGRQVGPTFLGEIPIHINLVFIQSQLLIFGYPLKYLDIVMLEHPFQLIIIVFHPQAFDVLPSLDPTSSFSLLWDYCCSLIFFLRFFQSLILSGYKCKYNGYTLLHNNNIDPNLGLKTYYFHVLNVASIVDNHSFDVFFSNRNISYPLLVDFHCNYSCYSRSDYTHFSQTSHFDLVNNLDYFAIYEPYRHSHVRQSQILKFSLGKFEWGKVLGVFNNFVLK